MIELNIETGRGQRTIFDSDESITTDALWNILEHKVRIRKLVFNLIEDANDKS